MAPVMYKSRDLRINERMVQMRLLEDGGCANLLALHNMLAIKGTSGLGMTNLQKEQVMMSKLQEKLKSSMEKIKDIPPEEAKEVQQTLSSIRTGFCFEPRLTGHLDFVTNGPRLVCELLGLPVYHAWVLDPQEESYDLFCSFSHSELVDHSMKEDDDHLDVCSRLLERKCTSYGIETLHEELSDNGTALLFRRDTLDVICKHNGHVFIFVADETIRKQTKADWMLLEEQEDQSIYFNNNFVPVKEQLHIEKALKWYREVMEKLRKPEEDKGKERKQGQSDDAGPVPREAPEKKAEAHSAGKSTTGNRPLAAESSESTTKRLTTGKGAAVGSHQSEVRQSDDVGGNSIPSEATGNRPEAVCSHQGRGGEVVSHHDSTLKSPQQAHSGSQSTTKILTTGKGAAVGSHQSEVRQSDDVGGNSIPSEATGNRPEAVCSHQGRGGEVVSHHDSTLKSPQQAHSADGVAESSKSTTGTTGNEAEESEEVERARAAGNISRSQDDVLDGDASDFLKFLDEFKDNGCSNHYFEGVVAAFASQRPLFYVPFEFIMSFNRPLALKIEDNYSGICEDLKKAVVLYLSKNRVDSPEAVLKILGRPEAKM